jgi:hypothetical protein
LIFYSFHPSEADYLVPEQFSFYGVKLLVSRPTPNLEDQGALFVWLLPFDLSGMGVPTSSYATAGISLRVSGVLKPHHHDKVEILSVGIFQYYEKEILICIALIKLTSLARSLPLFKL